MKKFIVCTLGICVPLLGQAAGINIMSSKFMSNVNPNLFCDAAPAVSALCNGRLNCAIPVTTNLCGDPDPSATKRLETSYQCGNGLTKNIMTQEYQPQVLRCTSLKE